MRRSADKPAKAGQCPCGRPSRQLRGPVDASKFAEWRVRLREYLASQRLKYTEQRWKIAVSILGSGGHVDAQALVSRVRQQHPGIGAATVYRNIKILRDAAILKESLVDSEGRVFYEVFGEDHHDHVVCMDCGHVFEFHNPEIEILQDAAVKSMGFKPAHHQHIVYARCGYKAT